MPSVPVFDICAARTPARYAPSWAFVSTFDTRPVFTALALASQTTTGTLNSSAIAGAAELYPDACAMIRSAPCCARRRRFGSTFSYPLPVASSTLAPLTAAAFFAPTYPCWVQPQVGGVSGAGQPAAQARGQQREGAVI